MSSIQFTAVKQKKTNNKTGKESKHLAPDQEDTLKCF